MNKKEDNMFLFKPNKPNNPAPVFNFSGNKIALCCGINDYPGTNNDLNGCVNDAKDWKDLLENQYGFKVTLLLNSDVTLANVSSALEEMVAKSKDIPEITWTNSSHGSNVPDVDGDEPDQRDECLCLYDKWMIDDDIRRILNKLSPTAKFTFISDSCISGDTKIPLLDGTNPTIKELADRKDKYWVYSCDENGNIVAGEGHSARKTKIDNVMKIILDNGEFLECTSDHLIMLRDGTYKEAGKLMEGESLMPFNRTLHDGVESKYLKGYEVIKNPANNKWIPTHLMVRDSVGLKKNNEERITHHINFNKLDNRPENLQMCIWENHKKMHGDVGKRNFEKVWKDNKKYISWRKSDEYKLKQSKRIKEKWADPEHHTLHKESNIKRFKRNGFSQKFIDYNFSEANRENSKRRQKEGGDLYKIFYSEEFQKKFRSAANSESTKEKRKETRKKLFLDKDSNLSKSLRTPERIDHLKKMSQYKRHLIKNNFTKNEFTFFQWKQQTLTATNHKISKIIKTNKIIDVYDLTVEKYHNFAINSGIFVHNCHSGSLTRSFMSTLNLDRSYAKPRFLPPEDYAGPVRSMGRILVPEASMNEVLISGCKAEEYSYDAVFNGRYNGAMSYYAIKVLKTRPTISYNDFYADLRKFLPSSSYPQSPELEGKEENKAKIMWIPK